MIKKPKQLGKVKESIVVGRALRGSCLALAVFALVFIFVPYVVAEASAANLVRLNISWGEVQLTLDPDRAATEAAADPDAEMALSTHGNVEFGDIVPSQKDTNTGNVGTMKITKKTVGVETNGKQYTLFLSMAGDENTLNLSGQTGTTISATNGTWDSPQAFSASGWGYAVPGTNTEKTGGGYPTFFNVNDFFSDDTYLDTGIMYTAGNVYSATRWAAVPAKTTPQQIYKATTNLDGFNYDASDATASHDNEVDVYYAVMVDTGVMAGEYSNNIVYTAIASKDSIDTVSYNLSRDHKFGGKGDTETIAFDLSQSVAMLTSSDVKVYMVPHADMVDNNGTPGDLSDDVDYDVMKLAGVTVVNGKITAVSYDECAVTKLEVGSRIGTLECTIPQETTGDGYDFWVSLPGYGYNYVSKITENSSNIAAFVYAGLQTEDGSGNRYVTRMQEMTAGVCAQTYKWNGKWGDGARLYTEDGKAMLGAVYDELAGTTGSGDINSASTINTAEGGATLAQKEAAVDKSLELGTFTLKDTRDGKRYLVRRLADGNCWMVQNLDLEIYEGMTLSAADTDIQGTESNPRDEWVVAEAGSLSSDWKNVHMVEQVTVTEKDLAWVDDPEDDEDSDVVNTINCSGGTNTSPCFGLATPAANTSGAVTIMSSGALPDASYFTITDSVNHLAGTAQTSAVAASATAYSEGTAVAVVKFWVKQIVDQTQAATPADWTSTVVSGDNSNYCMMAFDKNGVIYNYNGNGFKYCEMESTGELALVTQYDGMAGYAIELPNLYYPDNSSESNKIYTKTTLAGVGGNIGDYRWASNAVDGAHVYDNGTLVFYNNWVGGNKYATYKDKATILANDIIATQVGTSTYKQCNDSSAGYSYTIGTTQGEAGSSLDGYRFLTCLDNGVPAADSGMSGNLYNYYAATAGSGTSKTSGANAVDSICPLGWQLPSDNDTASLRGNKSFENLLASPYTHSTSFTDPENNLAYNLGEDNLSSSTYSLPTTNDYADASNQNLDTPVLSVPLSFTRTGYYYYPYAGLDHRSSGGSFRSSYAYNATVTRSLYFYRSYLNPRDSNYKGRGFSVRCVAR